MSHSVYVQASPCGDRWESIAVADAFLAACREAHPADTVETLNVFEADLLALDSLALHGKYAILHGREHTDDEAAAWQAVVALAATSSTPTATSPPCPPASGSPSAPPGIPSEQSPPAARAGKQRCAAGPSPVESVG